MSKRIEVKENNIVSATPWTKIDSDKLNPVSHTTQDYLKFVNTAYFSETSKYYLRHGVYTHAPEGTSEHIEFWDEQEKRCKYGYEVGGVRITGEHYAYLNYGRILATVDTG